MEQHRSWKCTTFSTAQKNAAILFDIKIQNSVRNSQPTVHLQATLI
jgi:hypothetical protein